MAIDPEMDVGGRVFLVDGFSAVAARVGRSFTALRGGFAQGVRGVGASSRQLADGLRQTARGVGTTMRGLASSVQRGWSAFANPRNGQGQFLTSPFTRLQGAMTATHGHLTTFVRRGTGLMNTFSRGVRRGIDSVTAGFGGLSRYLSVGGVVQGLTGLLRASVHAGSEMANLRIAFTTMMGSAAAAQEHLRALQQFGATTPFEFADLAVHSRNLQSFGFQVGQVIPLLREFGDAAFVTNTGNAGVGVLVRVFGNIQQTGRVTFGQLNQLAARGIPAHQILREQLNLTGEQLRNIARSGIPAERILTALRTGMRQRFAGGMERALDTIAARVSNLSDLWGMFLVQVGDRLQPVVIAFLRQFARVLDTINMDRLADRLGNVLSVATLVGRGVVAVLSVLGGAVSDTAERWNGSTQRMARGWTEWFGRVRDVLDGVVALLSTSNSRGVASIPRSLHDSLVRRGLWPVVLQIARWGDRVRQVIGGFLEGVAAEVRRSGAQLRTLAAVFGITTTGMVSNRAEARQLGADLARLVRGYVQLRAAMFGLSAASAVVSGAMTFGKAIGSVGRGLLWAGSAVVRFVRWLPVAAAWVGRFGQFLRAMGTAARVLGLGSVGAVLAIIAAQVTGIVLVWRNWTALQRNTGPMIALRTVAGALLGPWYALVHLIKEGPKQLTLLRGTLARVGQWFSATFARVAPLIGGAFRAAGSWVWRGLVAIFAPVGRFFRLVGAFAVVALYVAFASLWVKIGPPLTRFVTAAGRLLSRVGHAVGGAFAGVGHRIASLAGRFGAWVGNLASGAAQAIGTFARSVARRAMDVATDVRGVFARLVAAVGGFFSSLGRRAVVSLGPLLARVVGLAVALRTALGGAFAWVASTAQTAFGRLAEVILSPLRSIARQLVALFRALPRGLQPAALQGMVADLDTFGRSTDGPVGGPPPVPDGAQAGGAPPGPPPVPASVRQQAAGQARAAGRPPVAPVVHVTVPTPVVQSLQVSLDGRQITSNVERRQEGERLRQGRSG